MVPQTEITSLKNEVLKLVVLFIRKLTFLQIRQTPASSFFSLKGVFLIYLYYFSGFLFDFKLFSCCCPRPFFTFSCFIILVCFVMQTRIIFGLMLIFFFIVSFILENRSIIIIQKTIQKLNPLVKLVNHSTALIFTTIL